MSGGGAEVCGDPVGASAGMYVRDLDLAGVNTTRRWSLDMQYNILP